MSRLKKFIIGSLITITLVLIAIAIIIYSLISKSIPKFEGTLSAKGINSQIKISRDDFSVPYISATNEYDLYFSFGYTIAQDRLWQIDLERRIGQGRLSEILGERTLDLDVLSRTIGFERIARELEPKIDIQSRKILQAYSDGINYFISNNKDKLPLEFDLLQYEPERWEPIHSLIVLRVFAWQMNFGWWSDLLLNELIEKFGEKRASELFPTYPSQIPAIAINDKLNTTSVLKNFINAENIAQNFLGKSILAGSNNWVVAGNKSQSGYPLLANDPHLLLSLPSPWYLVSLNCRDMNVTGACLPGIPSIIIGHNDNIAWGITNAMVDDCDFYYEKIDSLGRNTFYLENQWHLLEKIVEKITVKKHDPFILNVFKTQNGPIVSSFKDIKGFYEYKTQYLPLNTDSVITGNQISMRWTGFEFSDELLGMYYINAAKNKEDFESGAKLIQVPGLNIVYADKNNIGYNLSAKIPIRKYSNIFLPVNGQHKENSWQGFVPEDILPRIWNPPAGFIATANNKISNDFPYQISSMWESPSRIKRITDILSSKEKFSIEDFQNMQNDVISPNAAELIPIFLNTLQKMNSNDLFYEQMITYFRNWDYSFTKESIPAALYSVLFVKILNNTFTDELGTDLFERYCFLAFLPTNVITKMLIENKSQWFDDIRTQNKIETRDDIIYKSALETIEYFKQELGSESKNWRLGKIHQLILKHPFGSQKPLDQIFNLGPFEVGGINTTINCGYFDFTNPYNQVVGQSLRFLIDMSNTSISYFVNSSGESGQPLSEHYQDQISLLLNQKYIEFNKSKFQDEKNKLLIINPEK